MLFCLFVTLSLAEQIYIQFQLLALSFKLFVTPYMFFPYCASQVFNVDLFRRFCFTLTWSGVQFSIPGLVFGNLVSSLLALAPTVRMSPPRYFSGQHRLLADFSLFARAVHVDLGHVDIFLVRKWDVMFIKKFITQFCVLGDLAPQAVVGHFGQHLIGVRDVALCSYYEPSRDPDSDLPSGVLVFLEVDLCSTVDVFPACIKLNGFCYHLHEGPWPETCFSLYEFLRRPFVEIERGSFNFRIFPFFFIKKLIFFFLTLCLSSFFFETKGFFFLCVTVDFSKLPDEWFSERMRFLRPG